MSDPYDQELFLGYIEGELSSQDAVQFDRAMAKDERLRRLVAQLQADRQLLRTMPQTEAPADLMNPVRDRLERDMLLGDAPVQEAKPLRNPGTWGRWIAYSGVAAIVAISATVVMLIFASSRNIWQQDHGETLALHTAPGHTEKRAEKSSTSATTTATSDIGATSLAMVDRREKELGDDVTGLGTSLRQPEDLKPIIRSPAGADRDGLESADLASTDAKGSADQPIGRAENSVASAPDGDPESDTEFHVGHLRGVGYVADSVSEGDREMRQPEVPSPTTEDARTGFSSLVKAPGSAGHPKFTAPNTFGSRTQNRNDRSAGTVGPVAITPAAQLQIVAKDPNRAKRNLISWASTRQVRVIPISEGQSTGWLARRGQAADAGHVAGKAADRDEMIFVVHAKAVQARRLLADMQNATDQTASIAAYELDIAKRLVTPSAQLARRSNRSILKANTQIEADVATLEHEGLALDSGGVGSVSKDNKQVAVPTKSRESYTRPVGLVRSSQSLPPKLQPATDPLPADPGEDVMLRVVIRAEAGVAALEEVTPVGDRD